MAAKVRVAPGADAGFTLVEVMIALLLAMVGLIGTVAMQQTAMNATLNASDSAIASRLASSAMEEVRARITLGPGANDFVAPIATGNWTTPVFLDANGTVSAARTPTARFSRRFLVQNLGIALPYNLSVEVSYALDSGAPRIVRLDAERRKTW